MGSWEEAGLASKGENGFCFSIDGLGKMEWSCLRICEIGGLSRIALSLGEYGTIGGGGGGGGFASGNGREQEVALGG